MGRFKTPFTASQKTYDEGINVPEGEGVSDRSIKLSPIHIGRKDIITPRTKSKIKERFAAQLAQQSNMRVTSPGVHVPFDLSQSQSTLSQNISITSNGQPGLNQSQQELLEVLHESMKENDDLHHTLTITNDDTTAEVIEFEEENLEMDNSALEEGATDTDRVLADSQGVFLLLSDDELLPAGTLDADHGHTPVGTSIAALSDLNIQVDSNKGTKTHSTNTSKRCRKNCDFEKASSNRQKMSRKNKFLLTKKKVLRVISQMHQEIEVFQKRRADLLIGNISKINSIGLPCEE